MFSNVCNDNGHATLFDIMQNRMRLPDQQTCQKHRSLTDNSMLFLSLQMVAVVVVVVVVVVVEIY